MTTIDQKAKIMERAYVDLDSYYCAKVPSHFKTSVMNYAKDHFPIGYGSLEQYEKQLNNFWSKRVKYVLNIYLNKNLGQNHGKVPYG